MKALKRLTKINYGVLQALMVILLMAILAVVLYEHWKLLQDYRHSKQKVEIDKSRGFTTIEPPTYTNFTVPKGEEVQYNLFSFEREKKENKTGNGEPGQPGTHGSPNGNNENEYELLGVIKRDKWMVVVRFNQDNKIRLFSIGDSISPNRRINQVTSTEITFTNTEGRSEVVKVFPVKVSKK